MMKRAPMWIAVLASTALVVGIIVACSGSGGSSSSSSNGSGSSNGGGLAYSGVTTAFETTPANTSASLSAMSSFIPECGATGLTAQAAAQRNQLRQAVSGAVRKLASIVKTGRVSKSFGDTPPADILGSCGGKITYLNYSELNGTASATLSFENYCSSDSTTGETTTVNGDIPFTTTGTPTANGPITTSLTASSQLLREVTTDASGKTVASSSMSFFNFIYTPGIPGQSPTAAKPDTYSADSLVMENNLTGKDIQATNVTATMGDTSTGGTQETVSGRLYSGVRGYLDVSTPTPLIKDSNGNLLSGGLMAMGANGGAINLTAVPGSVDGYTVSVNGTLMPGVKVSCSD